MIMLPNKFINIKNPIALGSKFNILGLAGKRRSGKNYCASLLTTLDDRFRELSFAESLKEIYAEEHGIEIEELNNPKFKEKHRRGLQTYSTQMKKNHGEFVFVNKFLNKVEPGKFYVVTDVRFLCELQTIVLLGGTVYKVHADNQVRAQRGWVFDPVIDTDSSETELGDLSSDTFYGCCKGGILYNNKGDVEVLTQLSEIISIHFSPSLEESHKKLKKIYEL